ncbi:MAG: DegT/DnrJ/EryC1/StrS family aminotransferase [Candidatus Eisenbacteria bacterium]
MRVRMLDTAAQFESLRKPILEAVERVLASGGWIGGPEVKGLEEEMARLLGARHAIAVASGTDALLLSLKALGVGRGDEVIVPTFTFFATAGAVVNAGARPVFADVEPAGMTLDPAALPRLVTERTKAVIPVDLFGQCAGYDAIRAALPTLPARPIAILEDAAQAIGATLDGRPAGALGDLADLAAFSFYPTKNLGACGDAGLVTTDDDALAAAVRRYAAHGSDGGYVHRVVGTNSRLDAVQAAILRVKLSRLPVWQKAREENARFYDARFAGHPALFPPAVLPGRRHVYHQYVIRVAGGGRDGLRRHLTDAGIDSGIYYPLPLHLQECFAPLGGRAGDCPVAEEAAGEVLALPVHPDVTPEQREYVASTVLAWADRQTT